MCGNMCLNNKNSVIISIVKKRVLKNRRKSMANEKFECKFCGYVYDPSEGDIDNGIEKGTAFDSVSESWVCPICGAEKDAFIPVED